MFLTGFADFLRLFRGNSSRAIRRRRLRELPLIESLEDRSLLTVFIETDTTWSADMTLTDNVVVRNNATLTIQSGVTVTAPLTTRSLIIGSTTTGTLIADGVTFNGYVTLDTKAQASLTNSHFTSGYFTVNEGAALSAFTGNDFHGNGRSMLVYPGFVPQITASNTFASNSEIALQEGIVSQNATWPKLQNTYYSLTGNVTVNGGATLTIEPQVTVNSQFTTQVLYIGTTTSGTLIADNVTFGYVTLDTKAQASLTNNHFNNGYLKINSGAALSALTGNDFHGNGWSMLLAPEYVTQISSSNTFGSSSEIAVQDGTLNQTSTWAKFPNASYSLNGIVTVNGGATLTIEPQVTLNSSFASQTLVIGTTTTGTLIADNVTFGYVTLDTKAQATLTNNNFASGVLRINDGATLSTFASNNIHGGGRSMLVYPDLVPLIATSNTFGISSEIGIQDGTINHNVVWPNLANSYFALTGTVYVNNGATLNIEPQVTVTSEFASQVLFIGYNTSGTLIADNVTLGHVTLDSNAHASLNNNHFVSGYLKIIEGSVVTSFSGNDFHGNGVPLQVYPSFVSQIDNSNTFGSGATINIASGILNQNSTWGPLPNTTYALAGPITVNGGALLTLLPGTVLDTGLSYALTIGSTTTGGISARGATLATNTILSSISFGEIFETYLDANLTVDAQSTVLIRDNFFTAGTIIANGSNTATIDLSQNFYGTTNVATIESQRITDKDDLSSRPQINVTSPISPDTISGTVWYDANWNGLQDRGEQGLSGLTVTLKNAGPDLTSGTADDSVVGTTTTSSTGRYAFSGLVQNTRYFVEFTAPSGDVFTLQDQVDDYRDSDANPSTGRTTVLPGWFNGAFDPKWDAGVHSAVASAPEIAVSTQGGVSLTDNLSTVDFSTTPQGTPVTRTLVVVNNGDSNLILQPATLPGGSSFTVTANFTAGQVLAPGESALLTVKFTAATSGSFSSVLQIPSNDADENPFRITLVGNADPAPAPKVLVKDENNFNVADNTGEVNFGVTPLGVAVTRTLTVTNTGDANLVLQPATVGPGFTIVTNFTANQVVAPGASTTLVVRLNGTTSGNVSIALAFDHNQPGDSHFNVTLLGYVEPAPAPEVNLHEQNGLALADGFGRLNFGSTPLGVSVTKTQVIVNEGNADLLLQPATVGTGFTILTNVSSGQILAPGATANLVVQLNGTAAGNVSATLAFDNNDANEGHYDITLVGYVQPAPAPEIGVRDAGGWNIPDNFGYAEFGTTPIGTPVTRTLVVTNYGSQDLILQPATVGTGFTIVTNFTANQVVAPGGSANLVVRFEATALGNQSTTLSFSNNDSDEGNYDFTVHGYVEPLPTPDVAVYVPFGANIAVGTGPYTFGSTVVGTPLSQTFVIVNQGNSDLVLQPASIGAGFTITSNFSVGQVLAPGATANLVVQLDATATGTSTATLTFNSNDPDENPFSFSVRGYVSPVPVPHTGVVGPGGNIITSGTGVLTFSPTQFGTAVSQTIVITNSGTSNLILQPAVVGAGFSITNNFTVNQIVLPGATATLVVVIDANVTGNVSSNLTFNTNDVSNPQYSFDLTGYVAPAPTPHVSLVDPAGNLIIGGTGSLHFDPTPFGNSLSQTLVITNTGTSNLIVQPAVVGAGFSITNNFTINQIILPGETAILVVVIDATVSGNVSANLTFDTNDSDNPQYWFTLDGYVAPPPAPHVNLMDPFGNLILPGSGALTFAPTLFGTSISQSLVITNSGDSDLILQPAVVGAGFSITNNFTVNQIVAPGASVVLIVVINANVSGNVSANLSFDTNDADAPTYNFVLNGFVSAPPAPRASLLDPFGNVISATGSTLQFSSTSLGTSLSQTLSITNTGNSDLILQPAVIEGAGFSITTNFTVNQIVAPGATVILVVVIDASASGNFSATLKFDTNDSDIPQYTFGLRGFVALPSKPQLLVLTSDGQGLPAGSGVFNFGLANFGASVSQSITITNTGHADLVLQPAVISAGFTIVNNFTVNQIVAPGAAATLVIAINTSTAGPISANLSFDTNDDTTSHFVCVVQGYVNPVANPQILVVGPDGANLPDATGKLQFLPAVQQSVVSKTVTIFNTGYTNLVLQPATLTGAGFSIQTNFTVNQIVAPGTSVILTIILNTSTPGIFQGTLTIPSSDPVTSAYQFGLGASVSPTPAPGLSVAIDGGPTLANDSGIVDLGVTTAGTARTQTIVVTNTGNADLVVQPAVLTGAGFTIVDNFTADQVLTPGSSYFLVVRIDATATGPFTGTLSFANNSAAANPFTIGLLAQVDPLPLPDLTVTLQNGPSLVDGLGLVDFGVATTGTPVTRTLVVTNTGTSGLILQPATMTGAGFSIVSNFAANQVVAAGASVTLTIQMDATAPGAYQAALTLPNNVTGLNPFDVDLRGHVDPVQAPHLSAALLNGPSLVNGTGSVSFESTPQGVARTQTIVVTNTGNGPLTLQPAGISGAGFSIVTNFTADQVLLPGASTSLVIQLDGTSVGSITGTLAFASSDPSSNPFSVALAGVVSASTAPEISVALLNGASLPDGTGTVNFGLSTLGAAVNRTLVITNIGNANLVLQPAILVGSGFAVVTNLTTGQVLTPGASTTLVLQMDASAIGPHDATLSFVNNDSDENPFNLTLTGNIDPVPVPNLQLVLQSGGQLTNNGLLQFGATTQGSAVTQTIVVTNTGSADLSLQPATLTGTGFTIVSNFSANQILIPGASTQLVVRLSATTTGHAQSNLSFANSVTGQSPFSLQLSGDVGPIAAPEISVREQDGPLILNNVGVLDFGSPLLGSQTVKTLAVTNVGTADLVLQPAAFNSSRFVIVSNFAENTVLAPGESANLIVRLDATQTGTISDTLSFANTDADEGTYQILVDATVLLAANPEITVFEQDGPELFDGASTLNFGPTTVGTAVTRTIVITNDGLAPLSLPPAQILSSGFVLPTNFPANLVLDPGMSVTLQIRMNATTIGNQTATLSLGNSDADENPFEITLQGAVNPLPIPAVQLRQKDGPVISLQGGTLNFGTTGKKTNSFQVIEITNTGGADLTLQPASLSTSANFSIVSNIPSGTVLHVGESTTIVLQLYSKKYGSFSSALSFATNDPQHSQVSVNLSGLVSKQKSAKSHAKSRHSGHQ